MKLKKNYDLDRKIRSDLHFKLFVGQSATLKLQLPKATRFLSKLLVVVNIMQYNEICIVV